MLKIIRESIRMTKKRKGKKCKNRWRDSECREARKRVRKALEKALVEECGGRLKRGEAKKRRSVPGCKLQRDNSEG